MSNPLYEHLRDTANDKGLLFVHTFSLIVAEGVISSKASFTRLHVEFSIISKHERNKSETPREFLERIGYSTDANGAVNLKAINEEHANPWLIFRIGPTADGGVVLGCQSYDPYETQLFGSRGNVTIPKDVLMDTSVWALRTTRLL